MLMGNNDGALAQDTQRGRFAKGLRIEWLGQTVASLCWIASVFSYGLTSAGDWLQLFAAAAWLMANLAALASDDEKSGREPPLRADS